MSRPAGGASIRPTLRAAARTLSSMTTLPEERTTLKSAMRPSEVMVMRRVVVNLADPTMLVGWSHMPKKRSWMSSW